MKIDLSGKKMVRPCFAIQIISILNTWKLKATLKLILKINNNIKIR